MAWLVVEASGDERRCALGPTTMLGRHPDCGLQILDPRASKRHCMIYQRGDELWLRDFDSANGTTVNNVPVRGEVLLRHEDRIQVGSTVLRLLERLPEGGERPAAERIELPGFRHELRKVPGDEEAVLLLYPDSDLPEVRYLHVHFHVGSAAASMFAMNALTSARVFSIVGDEAHYLMDALDQGALARALQGAPR